MVFQFFVFPPVARKYGVLNCFKLSSIIFPLAYMATPFTVLLPGSASQQVAIFLIMLVKSMAVIFAFPCSTILLTNSARSLALLGTLNGVSTSISAMGRAAGPALGGVTFTFGVDVGYVIIPWWTLASISFLGCLPIWWLVEMDGFGGDDEESDDEGQSHDDIYTEPNDTPLSPIAEEFRPQNASLDGTLSEAAEAIVDPDESAIEDDNRASVDVTRHLSRQTSRRSQSVTRKMIAPLGMGEEVIGPGGRRYSNGLGQTMAGLGTGGSPYH